MQPHPCTGQRHLPWVPLSPSTLSLRAPSTPHCCFPRRAPHWTLSSGGVGGCLCQPCITRTQCIAWHLGIIQWIILLNERIYIYNGNNNILPWGYILITAWSSQVHLLILGQDRISLGLCLHLPHAAEGKEHKLKSSWYSIESVLGSNSNSFTS